MKLSAIRFVIIVSFLFLEFGAAQSPNPLDFFPHHRGDVWEYWENNGGTISTVQNKILSDSLGLDGNYYLQTTLFDLMIFDTTNYLIYVNNWVAPEFIPWYKLDAQLDEQWVVYQNSLGFVVAIVSSIFQDVLFNSYPVTVKKFEYYGINWNYPQDSLWLGADYLATDFGLIQSDADLTGWLYLIKGALIDSVLYGDITVAIDDRSKTYIPKSFIVHQNYPNPFNPATTIEYELPAATKVELTVYDLMGRKVKTLVNARQPAGTHRVQFDGSQLSSGVYVYRLTTGSGFVATRKMILLR